MLQLSLFELEQPPQPPVTYIPSFLSKEDADLLLAHCLNDLRWQQNHIRMLGKLLQVPRLETICGDEGCDYLYSGQVLLSPHPWTTALDLLRVDIEQSFGYKYNIVIGSWYRDGNDSIGWHSDSEPSMGISPAIASISLGATRKFQIKPKKGGEITSYQLGHGDLVIMHPGCQQTWVHQVPKTKKPVGIRINLTFRPHINGLKGGAS